MNKLNPNLVAAFVFPDGNFLDACSTGHYQTARDYIKKNKSYDRRFKILSSKPESRIYTEEDFLIHILGALKLASYCVLGKKMYYDKERVNIEIVKYYDALGFKDPFKHDIKFNVTGYTQTVIVKHVDGKEILIYNPARIGD